MTFLGVSLGDQVGNNITNPHILCIEHIVTLHLHPGTAEHVSAVSTLGFELNSISRCACRRPEGRRQGLFIPPISPLFAHSLNGIIHVLKAVVLSNRFSKVPETSPFPYLFFTQNGFHILPIPLHDLLYCPLLYSWACHLYLPGPCPVGTVSNTAVDLLREQDRLCAPSSKLQAREKSEDES